MLPPYDTDEVARAVFQMARDRGEAPFAVTVMAHLRERRWTLAASFRDGEQFCVQAPFSQEEGVLTPAELAGDLLAELGAS